MYIAKRIRFSQFWNTAHNRRSYNKWNASSVHLPDNLAQTCRLVVPIIHAEDCSETTRAPEYTLTHPFSYLHTPSPTPTHSRHLTGYCHKWKRFNGAFIANLFADYQTPLLPLSSSSSCSSCSHDSRSRFTFLATLIHSPADATCWVPLKLIENAPHTYKNIHHTHTQQFSGNYEKLVEYLGRQSFAAFKMETCCTHTLTVSHTHTHTVGTHYY